MPGAEPDQASAEPVAVPAGETGGAAGERPWLLPPREEQHEAAGHPDGGDRGGTAFRIVVLVGLLCVVTAAGIVIGREIEPGSSSKAASTVTTTTAAVPPPSRTPRTPPPVRRQTVLWGPLRVLTFGELPKGGGQAGAALVGSTLAVVGGTGSARVLAGPVGGRLAVVGALRAPRASMQVFPAGGALWAVGGEAGATPTDAIQRIDLATGQARNVGTFEEPLAEAGVAPAAGSVYLVGGWTGTQYASAVLKFTPPSTVTLLTRLPVGVRSPAVTLLGHTIYVAGGSTDQGPSTGVYAVDVDTGGVTALGQLPQPVVGGVLVFRGTKLYLVGGRTTGGRASGAVISIDPATGSPKLVGRIHAPLVGASTVITGAHTLVIDAPSGTVYRVG